MTATATLQMTSSRWRLLNRLDVAGQAPSNAGGLLTEQQASPEDLHWLAESDLVTATLAGRTTSVDLRDHLAHQGDPAVIAVRLNARGRKSVSAWQNRVLRQLADSELPLNILATAAGVDRPQVVTLCRRGLLTVTVRATGEQIEADDVAILPDATMTVRLSDKGRTHLPTAGRTGPPVPAPRTGGGEGGHYVDQPRAADGKWIKVGDELGYADGENVHATGQVVGAGPVPTNLALIDYPDDGVNQQGAFVEVATPKAGYNPVTGQEGDGGSYCPPQLGPDEAETAAERLEELAAMVESGFRPPKPTVHTRARQRIEMLMAENRTTSRDRVMVGDQDDFPLTTGQLLKLLNEADPTLSAPQTRHAIRAHAAGAAGGEDGTLWLDMEPDAAGGMHIVVTAVEGTEDPDDDYNRQYAAQHTPETARELAGKLRAFARAARRRGTA